MFKVPNKYRVKTGKYESVNYHPYRLHLWRPVGRDILTPPPLFVGPVT